MPISAMAANGISQEIWPPSVEANIRPMPGLAAEAAEPSGPVGELAEVAGPAGPAEGSARAVPAGPRASAGPGAYPRPGTRARSGGAGPGDAEAVHARCR